MPKKTKLDVGKGFKRIYFVIAAIWVGINLLVYFADFMGCQVHKMDLIECINFNAAIHWLKFLIVAGMVVPLYYFLTWIAAGFKK